MLLKKIKNKFYHLFVEAIPEVQMHYEGYKDSNLNYHRKHRIQSLKFLLALRKFYKNGKKGVFPKAPAGYEVKRQVNRVSKANPSLRMVLQADIVSPTVISLKWPAIPEAKVYNLYRSENQKDYKFLKKGA